MLEYFDNHARASKILGSTNSPLGTSAYNYAENSKQASRIIMSKRVSNDHSPATGNNSGSHFTSAKRNGTLTPIYFRSFFNGKYLKNEIFPFETTPFLSFIVDTWIRFHWFRNLLFFSLKVKTRLRCFQVNVEIVLWNYHCMQDNGGIVFLFFQFLSCLRSFLFFFFSSLRIWNGKFVEKNILAMRISYTNLEL